MHRLSTDEEGIAKNTLWVADRRGNKLSNFHAEMLAERIGDFVVYCTPDTKVTPAFYSINDSAHLIFMLSSDTEPVHLYCSSGMQHTQQHS